MKFKNSIEKIGNDSLCHELVMLYINNARDKGYKQIQFIILYNIYYMNIYKM